MRQARRNTPSLAAVCALDDWSAGIALPFDVGPMGGTPHLECQYCASRNFAGERVGTGAGAHFALCCHEAKAASLLEWTANGA